MKKILILAILLIFAGSLIAQEQSRKPKEKKVIETKAVKIAKDRGANAGIRATKPVDDKIQEKPSDTLTVKTINCDVIIENHTEYTIDIYIDDYWVGTIGAWQKHVGWIKPGRTKIYGESIGGTVSWGPHWFDCNNEYTWRMLP